MQPPMPSEPLSPDSSASETQPNPEASREPAGGLVSLFLFGGAICWTIQLLFAVFISEWGCISGMGDFRLFGVTAIAWSVIAVSLLTMALTGWAMRLSLGSCRRQSRSAAESDSEDFAAERESARYLAQVAVWSNGLFLFIIVAQTIPILFYLTEC